MFRTHYSRFVLLNRPVTRVLNKASRKNHYSTPIIQESIRKAKVISLFKLRRSDLVDRQELTALSLTTQEPS